MTKERAIEILKENFDIDKYQQYREIHYLFFNNWNTGCDCAKSDLYRKLKKHALDNNYINKDNDMNKNQKKDNTGKYASTTDKPKPTTKTKEPDLKTSVENMKADLYAGNTDLDKIKEVYELIVKNDNPANINVMKRTILNHDIEYLD